MAVQRPIQRPITPTPGVKRPRQPLTNPDRAPDWPLSPQPRVINNPGSSKNGKKAKKKGK